MMALLVAIAGAAGLLASVILRAWGMTTMWMRYGLAVLEAYAVFLGCLWLWVHLQRRDPRWNDVRRTQRAVEDRGWSDPGFDGSVSDVSGHGSGGDLAGDILEIDELALIVALVVAIVSVLAVSLYVVVSAPSFLAELLLDGVFSAALYARLRRRDRHWLDGAVARTWKPIVFVAFCFAILGLLSQVVVPEAVTLGDVGRHWWEALSEVGR